MSGAAVAGAMRLGMMPGQLRLPTIELRTEDLRLLQDLGKLDRVDLMNLNDLMYVLETEASWLFKLGADHRPRTCR